MIRWFRTGLIAFIVLPFAPAPCLRNELLNWWRSTHFVFCLPTCRQMSCRDHMHEPPVGYLWGRASVSNKPKFRYACRVDPALTNLVDLTWTIGNIFSQYLFHSLEFRLYLTLMLLPPFFHFLKEIGNSEFQKCVHLVFRQSRSPKIVMLLPFTLSSFNLPGGILDIANGKYSRIGNCIFMLTFQVWDMFPLFNLLSHLKRTIPLPVMPTALALWFLTTLQ